MVGILHDGRECGSAASAFADDVASCMARDGQPIHVFRLVPTPVQAPRLLHTVRRADRPSARLEPALQPAGRLEENDLTRAVAGLAAQLATQVGLHRLVALHAFGADLAGRVALRVHEQTGLPYCVTLRNADLGNGATRRLIPAVLEKAQALLAFDATSPQLLQERLGIAPERVLVLPRSVDLETFRPLARPKRPKLAAAQLGRRELQSRLDGVDWLQSFVVLVVESRADRHGFERFLFAVPELLRLQPALQIVVVGGGDALTDGLRAALAAGRAELLHDIVATSEPCQPLVDHLECLHREHRAEAWWQAAARLEPERRVRFAGRVTRAEFAALLRLSDLFVLPGTKRRLPSQMLFEAVACGVLPVASESAGIEAVAVPLAAGVSAEIATLCTLRSEAPQVRELEERLGRVARLRPDLTSALHALASTAYDGGTAAAALRRAYAAALPSILDAPSALSPPR